MSREILLKNLFDKWKNQAHHKEGSFVTDGCVDLDKWNNQKRKILFLAKEAYGDNSTNWDLCEKIRVDWKGPKYKILWTLGYWAYGLQRLQKGLIPKFPDSEAEWELVKEAVLSFSIVNIKKSKGNSQSDDENLHEYLNLDHELIKEEVKILNPDIVVCCSTWKLVSKLLWPEAKQCDTLVHRNDNLWIIDFWHPANRYPDLLNYYALCAIAQRSIAVANGS